jgi:hypothetical protein
MRDDALSIASWFTALALAAITSSVPATPGLGVFASVLAKR